MVVSRGSFRRTESPRPHYHDIMYVYTHVVIISAANDGLLNT